MNQKEKCYFAYCWDDTEDTNDIWELMLYIKKKIEEKSKGDIQIFLDKKSSNTGENLKENENKIIKSDSVMIFFSPSYKRVIEEKDESRGVWREYEKILGAYNKKNLAVIPVVVNVDL
jgi:hypothetical protein